MISEGFDHAKLRLYFSPSCFSLSILDPMSLLFSTLGIGLIPDQDPVVKVTLTHHAQLH